MTSNVEEKDLEIIDKEINLLFKEICKEHGDKAFSSVWLKKNGYGSFLYKAQKHFGTWNNFKNNTKDGLPKINKSQKWPRELLIPLFKELYEEHGDNALS